MGYMFLPFRRYADFHGRSRRMEFWMFFLLNFIISAIFTTLFLILFLGKLIELANRYGYQAYERYSAGGSSFSVGWELNIPPDVLMAELGPAAIAWLVAVCVYSLFVFIPGLAVTIRRLHDTDKSGWFILLGLIPLVGAIILFVFYLIEGTRGPNRFGHDPKGYAPGPYY